MLNSPAVLIGLAVLAAGALFISQRLLRSKWRRALGRESPIIVGVVLGAIVGFLARPSIPMLGQLPFLAVVTRGAFFGGLDIVFRPTAEQSFNYMAIGAILGGILLFAVTGFLRKNERAGTSPATFCTQCGAKFTSSVRFCGACGKPRLLAE